MDEQIVARWQDWSGTGIEHTVISCTQASSTAEGVVIGAANSEPFAVRYQIRCDGSWTLNYASIEVIGRQRKVELHSDGRGKWTDASGNALPNLDGAIDVENDNGSITLTDVAGSVLAHSLNGKVIATLKRVTPQQPMSFASMNGSVDVTLPPDTKANLKLRTDNGDVWTDFDVQMRPGSQSNVVDTRNRGGRLRMDVDRSFVGTINGGGPDIELHTMNGSVYIRKSKP